MSDRTIRTLAEDCHLNPEQVRELFRLLEQKYSAPYILRYRKDLAANLDADDIAFLRRRLCEIQMLEKEKENILSELKEHDGVPDELFDEVKSSESISELYDFYVPYRPRKRSRSRLAQSKGLATLARDIIEHELDHANLAEGAAEYVDPDIDLENTADVLEGAVHIIDDWIAEEKSHREAQRRVIDKKGRLVAKRTGKWDKRLHEEFKEYGNFDVRVAEIHPYQVLCLMRGKRINALRYRIEAPKEDMCLQAAELYLEGGEDEFYEIDAIFHDQNSLPKGEELQQLTGPQLLYWCIRESVHRTLAPILSKEKERELRQTAQEHALDIIRRNLRSKLLTKPVDNCKILGIEPGFRTGCKLVALDKNGNLLDYKTVYPHTPKNQWDEAKEVISSMIKDNELSLGCIGNNNGCRETEQILTEVVNEQCPDFSYTTLEAEPAEIYAKSNTARKEIDKNVPKKLYTAVALGKLLLNPMEELCKIPLTKLNTSPYLKEIDKRRLESELHYVAEECVGEVGPDTNTAPAELIQYVPGLNYKAASEIVAWREENGKFHSRKAIRELPGIDIEMWYKAAPFVRIPGSENYLDNTRIHPDHYRVAEAMADQMGLPIDDLKDGEKEKLIEEKKGNVDFGELEDKFEMHYLYLKDILDELKKPWPDPRQEHPSFLFRKGQLSFENIQQFQMLQGVIQKVVDFGAFVDIGIEEDGLVHISELSEHFVKSPFDVVFVGERVSVWVVDVDPDNKRIALSMRSEESARKAAEKRAKIKEKKEAQKRVEQKKKEARANVPVSDLPASMQQTKTAAGQQSQRMKKIKEFSEQKSKQIAGSKDASDDGHGKKDAGKKADESQDLQGSNLLTRLQFASIEKRGEEK